MLVRVVPPGPTDRPQRAKAMVFEDPASRLLLARIEQIAPSDASVLITGETGTGKEIVARALHEHSARRAGPFVAVNCGALPESLVEGELFGHERGAFTGAAQAKAGWFEAAHGGTLVLDELGELPLSLQVKLLRVLQEREVVRLGSRQPIPVDVRVVAMTNVDLHAAIAARRFREDLFYRLHVASLEVRPLRERPGDILPLAAHFLRAYAGGGAPPALTGAAEARLLAYCWPGNIRQLENVVHHAVIMARGGRIEADDLRLPERPGCPAGPDAALPVLREAGDPLAALEAAVVRLLDEARPGLHRDIEHAVVRAAYRHAGRNQLQAARLLGISRNVVRARLIAAGEIDGVVRRDRQGDEAPEAIPAE